MVKSGSLGFRWILARARAGVPVASVCVGLLVLSAGCKDDRPSQKEPSGPLEACAARNCSYGLAIRFANLPPGLYAVEVSGDGAHVEKQSCNVRFPETQAGPKGSLSHVGVSCALLVPQTPKQVTVRIQGPQGKRERSFQPNYQEAAKGCPRECRQAVVAWGEGK